jgi:hypothetical protein
MIINYLLGNFFESLGNLFMPPQIKLLKKIFGFGLTQAIYVVCKLKIPDLLREDPKSVKEIAGTLHLQEGPLYRVLHALSSVKLFKELSGKVFMLKKEGMFLSRDFPESFYPLAMFLGKDPYKAWGNLSYSIETGKASIDQIIGKDYYSYLVDDNESREAFELIQSLLDRYIRLLLMKYDFSQYTHVADIGGGTGSVLLALLNKYESLQGTLVELPYTIIPEILVF